MSAATWFTDNELNTALHAIEVNRATGSSISVTEHSLRQLFALDGLLRPAFEHVQKAGFDTAAVNERAMRRYEADAGLRAMYSTAARFLDHASADFVAKKTGEDVKEMPMKSFANNRGKLLAGVDQKAALAAYGIQVYRNIVVEHEKAGKVPGAGADKEGFHLSTMAMHVEPAWQTEVDDLWKTHCGATTKPSETNFWNRTRLLYDSVPLLSANQLHPDRTRIDDVCRNAGLQSKSANAVVAACVAWPKALAKAL